MHYNTLHYITLQYCTLQYTTIQYNTLQYTNLQNPTLQYTALHYNTLHYNITTIQYNTLQYATIQCITLQYTTIYGVSHLTWLFTTPHASINEIKAFHVSACHYTCKNVGKTNTSVARLSICPKFLIRRQLFGRVRILAYWSCVVWELNQPVDKTNCMHIWIGRRQE